MHGTPSIVQLLLQRRAIPTTWNRDGDTLLHCEAWAGTAATVRLFLEIGLNIEAKNKRHSTRPQNMVDSITLKSYCNGGRMSTPSITKGAPRYRRS
jgi:ankyrin repeat protein